MGIIKSMRKQNAVYWPPSTVDGFGRRSFGTAVALVLADDGANYRVRWEGRVEEFIDPQGTTRMSNAVVYVPRLPDTGEIVNGGYLWLGDLADLTDADVPLNNEGAYEIRRVDSMPNLKNSETLRTVYL